MRHQYHQRHAYPAHLDNDQAHFPRHQPLATRQYESVLQKYFQTQGSRLVFVVVKPEPR